MSIFSWFSRFLNRRDRLYRAGLLGVPRATWQRPVVDHPEVERVRTEAIKALSEEEDAVVDSPGIEAADLDSDAPASAHAQREADIERERKRRLGLGPRRRPDS